MFKRTPIHLYYSLYSLGMLAFRFSFFVCFSQIDPVFRSKWLPNAIDPYDALDQLKSWEDHSGEQLFYTILLFVRCESIQYYYSIMLSSLLLII